MKRISEEEELLALCEKDCTKLRQQLAAERQQRKNADDAYALVSEKNRELNRQLGAERQRREQAEQLRDAAMLREVLLGRKLLSALAAIEKLHGLAESAIYALKGRLPNPDICNRDLIGEALINDLTKQIDAVKRDLSAMHEHDAKVREPLVEALEYIANFGGDCFHHDEVVKRAKDALAKIQK